MARETFRMTIGLAQGGKRNVRDDKKIDLVYKHVMQVQQVIHLIHLIHSVVLEFLGR
jgi:hypothetical protein